MVLALLVITAFYTLIPFWIEPAATTLTAPILAFGMLVISVGYLLSRTRYHRWSAVLIAAHIGGVVYAEVFLNPALAVGLYRLCALSTLLCAILLPSRFVVFTVIANLIIGGLRLWTLPMDAQLEFAYAVLLVSATGGLLLVFIFHRDRLEARRRAALTARSAANRQLAEQYAKANNELHQALTNLDHLFATLDAETRTATEALNDARQAALKAMHQKTEFVSNISHEIRTPMTGIIGMFEMLRETPLSDEQGEYVTLGSDSAHKLLHIMNDILDFSKLEAGKVHLDIKSVEIRQLCHSIKALLLPQWTRANLDFLVEIDSAVPPILRADETRLRQALTNLASNAIKFTHSGGVRLHVSAQPHDAEHERVRFAVSDTGIGIPKNQIEGIFEGFVQGDPSSTRRYGGTGLGLAIARQSIRLMGGEIAIESEVGKGSTFTFTLLMQKGTMDAPPLAPPTYKLGAPNPSRGETHILIVEDNPINRELLVRMFQGMQVKTQEAADGILAVKAAQNQPFDLIVMDVRLPLMDGIETTHQIRALPLNAQTPIVAVTASIMPEEQARYLREGMNDILCKPFSIDELRAMLARWLPQLR